MMPQHPYLAVEGAIGAGKTTLARIIGDALPAEILLEVFEENPFLSDFYADRARYAFQTQIFFLLSRYRQQHRVIADTLGHSPLASDYLFAKDWLFAHLNLTGDELAMYERVHAILGEQIPTPSLVVYLRASTETLMRRIAYRDRPYERQMDGDYIQALCRAYDGFFESYSAAPVLTVDTDDLDIVHDSEARGQILALVRNALVGFSYQMSLPVDDERGGPAARVWPSKGFLAGAPASRAETAPSPRAAGDLYLDYIGLTRALGDLAGALQRIWQDEDSRVARVGNRKEARDLALEAVHDVLEGALVDAQHCLFRFASDTGIDLEAAYQRSARRKP